VHCKLDAKHSQYFLRHLVFEQLQPDVFTFLLEEDVSILSVSNNGVL
jgi:hypothetical protein